MGASPLYSGAKEGTNLEKSQYTNIKRLGIDPNLFIKYQLNTTYYIFYL
ncbi:hypothetical protein NL50_02555 [Clostridium acetobutylicum]|nr:hypothetical protein NL50_02555 [Clostridium acetobutylicum]